MNLESEMITSPVKTVIIIKMMQTIGMFGFLWIKQLISFIFSLQFFYLFALNWTLFIPLYIEASHV